MQKFHQSVMVFAVFGLVSFMWTKLPMKRINRIKNLTQQTVKLSNKPLIISAGMTRSGSTLLFNMLREILTVKWGNNLSSGWEGNLLSLPAGQAYLVKTHGLSRFYLWRSSYKFYSYRDVRVAAVSNLRKFNKPITLKSIEKRIGQYDLAKQSCDLIIKYEELIDNEIKFIDEISTKLDIKVDSDSIFQKLEDIKLKASGAGYSKETLLHKDHFTNTKDHEWREIIPKELQSEINTKFAWWFEECGYPLT